MSAASAVPKCKALTDTHKQDCRYLTASICAVPIECEHGFDVCPMCDPCECDPEGKLFEPKEIKS